MAGHARPAQAVLVEDTRIVSVGAVQEIEQRAPPDCVVVDLGNCCLAPGLIDGHTHLSLAGDGRSYAEMFGESDEMMTVVGAMNLTRHLRAGITTIREHGARNQVGFVLKEGVGRGYLAGLACRCADARLPAPADISTCVTKRPMERTR